MSDYKKQHYVPQTYLKAWADENNKVYISQGIKDHFSSDSDFTVIKK